MSKSLKALNLLASQSKDSKYVYALKNIVKRDLLSYELEKKFVNICLDKKIDLLKLTDCIVNMDLKDPFLYNKDMDIAYQLTNDEYEYCYNYIKGYRK